MNESKKFNSNGRAECLVRGESTKIHFGVCADPHVVIKHHHTNAFMLFTHRKIHHHYPLFPSFISLFYAGTKTSCLACACVGWMYADDESRWWIKRVKECTRQLWKIIVGEWSHCENLSISVTRHFHYMRPHIHQSAFKDFSLLLFKRPNKLELLSRGWSTAYGASDVFGWQTKLNELLSIVASGRRRTFTWKVPCGECETKWKSCDENLMKAKNIFPDENYLHLTQFEWHKVRIKLPRSDSNWYYVP